MADTLFNICFLKKFNNYFNRKVIGFETLAEYINAAEDFFIPDHTISFDPKDNVSTEIIMNDCPFDADYCLVLNLENNILTRWFVMEVVFIRKGQKTYKLRRDVIYDYLEEILPSPVFVQKGMLRETDAFILNDEGMSFNQIKRGELMLQDDTKSSYIVGYLAKNATPTTVNIQTSSQNIEVDTTLSHIASEAGISESDLASVLNFENDRTVPANFAKGFQIKYGGKSFDNMILFKSLINITGNFTAYDVPSCVLPFAWTKPLIHLSHPNLLENAQGKIDEAARIIARKIIDNAASMPSTISSLFGNTYFYREQLNVLREYCGKTISYNGTVYQFDIQEVGEIEQTVGPSDSSGFGAISSAITSAFNEINFATRYNDGEISVRMDSIQCYVILRAQTISDKIPGISVNIPATRNVNNNNAFDLFVIPTSAIISETGENDFSCSALQAQRVAAEIAKELDSNCYDIQLLPYFPMVNIIKNGKIDLDNLIEDYDYSFIEEVLDNYTFEFELRGSQFTRRQDLELTPPPFVYQGIFEVMTGEFTVTITPTVTITDGNAYVSGTPTVTADTSDGKLKISILMQTTTTGTVQIASIKMNVKVKIDSGSRKASIMFFPKTDSFKAYINQDIESEEESLKIENECHKYRICSPNYQGSFDFSIAKNGGSVRGFVAECTYKPYTPYIKVAPNFKYMYGANYGDARGLICSGDFSMSRFTSAWENFELNNKNYQNIFNREIQSLDIQQDLAYRKQLITGGLGIFTGGIGGAAAGGMASGSWIGAIVGGAAGLGASSAGFALDTEMLVRQQREEKQLAIDKFNYQLGNIKALPYTLTKVSAFNINFKIWPFVEFYSCTSEEKEALENKIKYESMTVMRIGNVINYYRFDSELHYFKGELIRNEEIAEDNHIFEAIYGEILKGVYM